MHPAYKCDFCGRSFTIEAECDTHELEHKMKNELRDVIPHKFEVGDMVRIIGGDDLLIIKSREVCPTYPPTSFGWRYGMECGADFFYEPEEDLELIVTKDQLKEIVDEVNTILKKYNPHLNVNGDNLEEWDGAPILEMVLYEH